MGKSFVVCLLAYFKTVSSVVNCSIIATKLSQPEPSLEALLFAGIAPRLSRLDSDRRRFLFTQMRAISLETITCRVLAVLANSALASKL